MAVLQRAGGYGSLPSSKIHRANCPDAGMGRSYRDTLSSRVSRDALRGGKGQEWGRSGRVPDQPADPCPGAPDHTHSNWAAQDGPECSPSPRGWASPATQRLHRS